MDSGVRKWGAARHIESAVPNELSHHVSKAGFRDVSFQLLDHDWGGTEQLVLHSTGRGTFVSFDLAVPSFKLETDGGCIVVLKIDKGREQKHGATEDDAFEC